MLLSSSPLSSGALSSVLEQGTSILSGTITLSVQDIDGGFISVIGAGYVPITSEIYTNTLYSVRIDNTLYSTNLY